MIAQAQTALEAAFPDESAPSIVGGITPDTARSLIELQDMTNVIIIASLLIAGCSLAVSVAAGMSERKRPFSLLRLGVPIRMLRRVVALEAAAPLLVIAVLASAIGLLAAELFLRGELRVSAPAYLVSGTTSSSAAGSLPLSGSSHRLFRSSIA